MSGNKIIVSEVSDLGEGVTVNESLERIKNVFADIKDSLKDIDKVSWFLGGLALGIGLGALSQYIYNADSTFYNEHADEFCIPRNLQETDDLKHDRDVRHDRIMERRIKQYKLLDERDATTKRDQD